MNQGLDFTFKSCGKAWELVKLQVMKKLLFSTVCFLAHFAKAEIFEIKLRSDHQVCQSISQVTIHQDRKVIYQLKIPINGSGQVHLLTGNYQIDVVNKDGCSSQKFFQVSDLTSKLIEVRLEASTSEEKTQHDLICAWGIFGCEGGYYPYNGEIAMGQLKVYLTGKPDGKFKLKFNADHLNLLATVPSFNSKEITGELREGSILTDNTLYSSLSYQARVPDDDFQSDKGFCGTKKEVFQFMMTSLKVASFPIQARIDFADYWAAKLPEASKYCVFPQVNVQLEKIVSFEFSFDDKAEVRIERLFFLIIPQDYKGQRVSAIQNRFSLKPKSKWKPVTRLGVSKAAELHEWGVGFIFE